MPENQVAITVACPNCGEPQKGWTTKDLAREIGSPLRIGDQFQLRGSAPAAGALVCRTTCKCGVRLRQVVRIAGGQLRQPIEKDLHIAPLSEGEQSDGRAFSL